MKNVICTEAAPAAIGPYSQAIETAGTVYISGIFYNERAHMLVRSLVKRQDISPENPDPQHKYGKQDLQFPFPL